MRLEGTSDIRTKSSVQIFSLFRGNSLRFHEYRVLVIHVLNAALFAKYIILRLHFSQLNRSICPIGVKGGRN